MCHSSLIIREEFVLVARQEVDVGGDASIHAVNVSVCGILHKAASISKPVARSSLCKIIWFDTPPCGRGLHTHCRTDVCDWRQVNSSIHGGPVAQWIPSGMLHLNGDVGVSCSLELLWW